MREPGPIGSKLELHGNSSYDAKEKIDCKYLGPETCGLVVSLISFPQRERLENDDERGQPHCQLRKEIVIGNRERKMQPMNYECAIHYACPLRCFRRYYLLRVRTNSRCLPFRPRAETRCCSPNECVDADPSQ